MGIKILGNQTSNATTNYNTARVPLVQTFSASATGVVKRLGIKLGFASSIRLFVYSSVSGSPSALLGYTDVFSVAANTETMSPIISGDFSLTSGTAYYIGFVINSASATAEYLNNAVAQIGARLGTAYGAIANLPPSTWSNVTGFARYPFHVWAEMDNSISSATNLKSGETASLTLSASASAVTNIAITGANGQTINISSGITGGGTSWSYTAPTMADGVVGLNCAAVSIVATIDGAASAAYTSATYSPETGKIKFDLTSVSVDALSPAGITLTAGDQWIQPSDTAIYGSFFDLTGTGTTDGVFETTYTGTIPLIYYSSVDYKRRFVDLEVSGGVISGGGLTTKLVTGSKLTVSKLVARRI